MNPSGKICNKMRINFYFIVIFVITGNALVFTPVSYVEIKLESSIDSLQSSSLIFSNMNGLWFVYFFF